LAGSPTTETVGEPAGKTKERIPMQNLEKKDISAPPYQYSQPQEPSLPPALSKRPRHGPRTAAIVALTLLLAIVFGTGLFAGWEFGSRNAGTATSPTTIVQSGTDAGRTIPPLTKDNAEAVREAVIAKVRPAVVQVNITTQSSIGLGSGVIIDRRGYIITNNHVIDGAQKIEVVLYDGTKIQAQPVQAIGGCHGTYRGGYRLAMYARWDLVLFRSKSVTRLYVLPGYLSPTYR